MKERKGRRKEHAKKGCTFSKTFECGVYRRLVNDDPKK
jgi:hypothetical protein